jgi:predicted nucleotidyltransferase component of viral defense system
MKRDSLFFKQAELMLRIIPYVATEKCFALKGGTAINFFLRDMPRLSVDIDLTYLPLENRDTSLQKMSDALERIAVAIRKANRTLKVQESRAGKRIAKLFVNNGSEQIAIEPNEVIRGAIYKASELSVSPTVEETFELSAAIQVLSIPDLYGGKLCAALDRQHPRDIFDVKLLLENEGITDEIRQAFVVYLASHDRPINELIDPHRKNVRQIHDREFVGMTTEPISYEELEKVRERYIEILKRDLTQDERQFLVSVKTMNPDWKLLCLEGIEKLPAIQWKLLNIGKMSKKKHAQSLSLLKAKLGV